MKPTSESDVRFFEDRTMFLFFTNKQSAIQNRHRSIENATPMLERFGYIVKQSTKVRKGGGYGHVVMFIPWKKGKIEPLQAEPAGQFGIIISARIETQYDAPSIPIKVGDDLWYTPPIDVKRQVLPPARAESFYFPGTPDGKIWIDAV